jgi:hypothetical protein
MEFLAFLGPGNQIEAVNSKTLRAAHASAADSSKTVQSPPVACMLAESGQP